MKNRNKQTKFPVARIKRIMQKDEEVGKVAQATPVVISKALEMFLAMLVEESNKVTASRGSKKVEAYHLKHAVETVETLDFLKEIVEPVPDPSAGGTINLDAVDNSGGGEQKKKRATRGKKAAGGEDEEGNSSAPKRRRKKKKEEEAEDVTMEGTGGAEEDEE